MDDLTLFVLSLLVLLVICDVVAVIIANRRNAKLDAAKKTCTQRTMATVVETSIEYPAFANLSPCSFPIFEYTANGQTMRTKYAYGTYPKFKEFNAAKWLGSKKVTAQFSEGMRVEIAYDPADPGYICVPSDKEPYKRSRGIVLTTVITTVAFAIVIVGSVALLSMP